MFESSQYQGQSAAQSNRGRKKKNAAASSGSLNQSKMYRQQQQHYGPGQHQFGQRGGSSSFSNQMPPPSMHSLRQSTGMGLGLPSEEDTSDFILDDLDRLTPRSIAIARYKRNHELLSLVFDARRIDTLEPPASPYADIDQAALKQDLQTTQDEIEELRQSHAKRIKILKEDFAKQDAYLHDVKKKGKGLSASLESGVIQAMQTEEAEETIEAEEEWAKEPSKGRIVGVGYVRVSTPEEVRALLPKASIPVAAGAMPPTIGVAPVAEVQAAVPSSIQGEQVSAPLLAGANSTKQEQDESGLGDDSAMTGISLEGVEAEDEAEDDDEEDDEEEEDGDQQEAIAEGEDDADAEGDEDADGDADGDVDADAHGDAEGEENSGLVPQEAAMSTNIAEESIPLPALTDTTMLEPEVQVESASVPVTSTDIDDVEVARVEKERELVEEVNRQHGVATEQDPVSEVNEAAAEAFDEPQVEAAPFVQGESLTQPPPPTTTEEEEMAVDVPTEADSVV